MKKIFYLIIALNLFACNNNQNINIPTMATIMADMHLADAYANYCYKTDTNRIKNNISKNIDTLKYCYSQVFSKYNITETQFMNNLNYYKAQPKLWDSLYASIQKKLEESRPKIINK